jgi:endo-1,4-beta-xylanase
LLIRRILTKYHFILNQISGLTNNYPWKDWYNTGGSWTEAFETTTEWQQVNFTLDDFTGTTFTMSFDLGYVTGVTYYIDVENIKVVDQDAEDEVINLLDNGDFEETSITGWGGWGATRELSADGEGYGDTGYALKLTVAAGDLGEVYSVQTNYDLGDSLQDATEYTVSFVAKASQAANIRVQLQNDSYAGDAASFTLTTAWTYYTATITTTTADKHKFVFDTGETEGTYFFDDVVVTDGETGGSSEPTIIEKTDEEKAEIIGDELENWITGMVSHYKSSITAWDVVNEPMLESGEVRDGDISDDELADGEFYWQKYLGKDYAVTAFTLARENGNANDKLFINDYNLESNTTKLEGLIEYVQYIETNGATIDGIGTQMHISYDSDSSMIIDMFQKLANTGKLIKISELDIQLGTSTPTTTLLATQADMYRFVIESYLEYIPEDQQYGITIWGISDNAQEHEYWLPDESPNLWDADYERKHAYMGAANGLAGYDVSEDFTGELIY